MKQEYKKWVLGVMTFDEYIEYLKGQGYSIVSITPTGYYKAEGCQLLSSATVLVERKVEEEIKISQTVSIFIDGNNIGRSIDEVYGENTMLNVDVIIPKILSRRSLNGLVYLREGKFISSKFTERLKRKYFGIVEPCHKSADIPLTIHAVKQSEKVDTIVICSGDSDYLPLVTYLKAVGVRVEIVCVRHSASKTLLAAADSYYFIQKDDVFNLNEIHPPLPPVAPNS